MPFSRVAATLILLLFLSTPARSVILSQSVDSSHGRWGVTDDPSYAGVARVCLRNGEGDMSCEASGVLAGPASVLTAAHAVLRSDGTVASPGDIRVEIGGRPLPVGEVLVHPAFDAFTWHADIAVLGLAGQHDLPVPYALDLGGLGDPRGMVAVLAGYGDSGSALAGVAPGTGHSLRRAYNVIDAISDGAMCFGDPGGRDYCPPRDMLLLDFDDHRFPGQNGVDRCGLVSDKLPGGGAVSDQEGITAFGDSGCPLFVEHPEGVGLVVVGVASGGLDPSSRWGAICEFTRLAAFASFLRESIPGLVAVE